MAQILQRKSSDAQLSKNIGVAIGWPGLEHVQLRKLENFMKNPSKTRYFTNQNQTRFLVFSKTYVIFKLMYLRNDELEHPAKWRVGKPYGGVKHDIRWQVWATS